MQIFSRCGAGKVSRQGEQARTLMWQKEIWKLGVEIVGLLLPKWLTCFVGLHLFLEIAQSKGIWENFKLFGGISNLSCYHRRDKWWDEIALFLTLWSICGIDNNRNKWWAAKFQKSPISVEIAEYRFHYRSFQYSNVEFCISRNEFKRLFLMCSWSRKIGKYCNQWARWQCGSTFKHIELPNGFLHGCNNNHNDKSRLLEFELSKLKMKWSGF